MNTASQLLWAERDRDNALDKVDELEHALSVAVSSRDIFIRDLKAERDAAVALLRDATQFVARGTSTRRECEAFLVDLDAKGGTKP